VSDSSVLIEEDENEVFLVYRPYPLDLGWELGGPPAAFRVPAAAAAFRSGKEKLTTLTQIAP